MTQHGPVDTPDWIVKRLATSGVAKIEQEISDISTAFFLSNWKSEADGEQERSWTSVRESSEER